MKAPVLTGGPVSGPMRLSRGVNVSDSAWLQGYAIAYARTAAETGKALLSGKAALFEQLSDHFQTLQPGNI